MTPDLTITKTITIKDIDVSFNNQKRFLPHLDSNRWTILVHIQKRTHT